MNGVKLLPLFPFKKKCNRRTEQLAPTASKDVSSAIFLTVWSTQTTTSSGVTITAHVSPLRSSSTSIFFPLHAGATAVFSPLRAGANAVDGAVLRHPLGNPKRKVWGAQQQVSLNCETKVYRTSRRKPNFRRWCLLASWHSRQWRQKMLVRLHLAATWNLHTTRPRTLLQTYDEVINLTGLL
jgi:hypothetical protein